MPNLKNKTKFTGSSIPKNSGWLEKYGDGGETDPPFLEIKKPIIAEAESTGVAKPNITNINLNEKHLGRDRESLNYMHALQLLKKHDVTVDSTGNILEDIGLPSSAYYNPITRTINYKPTEENKRDYKFSLKKEYTDMIMKELPHAIQSDSLGTLKFLKNTIKEGISDVITNKLEKTGLNRYDENDKIEGHAHNVLEQKLIKERNKALGYDKFNYNLMSSTLKLKKVSKYVNTKKEMGGWLDTYAGGGETDPPVNLRSASTQLASPVSTQAPEVPLNKTGWDWVKQKYENRQPSEWNMLMMDKSGSYVDSGIDPFSLMLTAPQQVIKAGVKGGKALLDASKSNKIKQVIHQNELRDIENLKKSFKEAQELKNKDVNTVEIYKNIKSGENWKYPNINITKEQYNSAKNNLKIGPYTAISFAKNNPDKIIIPSKSDNLFKNTPSGNTFYQFYGEGPMSNHTIYTPDIHDYINKYHPYTTSRANLESIDLARKDGLKDVSKYFKENFKDYKIPINDFISLPQNKYGGIVKTLQNKQDNSQWLEKYGL